MSVNDYEKEIRKSMAASVRKSTRFAEQLRASYIKREDQKKINESDNTAASVGNSIVIAKQGVEPQENLFMEKKEITM